MLYLLGLDAFATGPVARARLTPHVPNGWDHLAANGLRVGGAVIDVTVRETKGERTYELANRGYVAWVRTRRSAEQSHQRLLFWRRLYAFADRRRVISLWSAVQISPGSNLRPSTSSSVRRRMNGRPGLVWSCQRTSY